MNDIQNSIFEAMRMFSNDSVQKSEAAQTIKCEIDSVIDEGLGTYKVKYLDNIFNVMSSTSTRYSIGEIVYVIIPDGDFSKEKFILGSVSPKTSYRIGDSQNYYDISDNFISGSLIEISSYDTVSNTISLTEESNEVLMEYLKEHRTLAFGFDVKTNLAESQTGGQYGVNINIPLLAAAEDGSGLKSVIKSYGLDTSNILGTPYSILEWSPQFITFDIDTQYELDLETPITFTVFCEGFPQDVNKKDIKDIFFNNLFLKVVKEYTEDDYIGYKLTLKSTNGNYFLKGDTQAKTIVPSLRVNGAATAFNRFPCYWFIEDSLVKPGHADYLHYSGYGWRCINKKENVNKEDNTFNYITNEYELKIDTSLVVSQARVKCVILYNDSIVSSIIALRNLNSGIQIDLFPTKGNNTFIKGAGFAELTVRYFEEGYSSLEANKPNIKYIWARYDKNGKLIKDNSDLPIVESYNLIKLVDGYSCFETEVKIPTNMIEDFNNIYCSVYKTVEGKEILIETKRLLVSVSDEWDYRLVVNNGNKIYKYDSDGDSPRLDAYDGPVSSKVNEIAPLSYQIYKADGTELTKDEYLQCKYTWYIPINSMFEIDTTGVEQDDMYYIISGKGNETQIAYDIARRFDKSKSDNNILLHVDFLGNLLDNIVNINFLKDGASGTNGTKYAAVPVMVDPNGNRYPYGARGGDFGFVQKLHFIYTVAGNKWFWHDTRDNSIKAFGTQLPIGVMIYEDGELLQHGSDYTVSYNMFDATITNPCFDISTTQGNPQTNIITKNIAMDINTTYCNIIQAKVTITRRGNDSAAAADTIIYAYYPIEVTITNIKDQKDMLVIPTIEGGFSEVLYATDGTNPKWDETYPFYCDESVLEENIREYYSCTWEAQHHLHDSYKANEEDKKNGIYYVQPSAKYDDGNSKNYVKATLAFDSNLESNLNIQIINNTTEITDLGNAIDSSEKIYNSVVTAQQRFFDEEFDKQVEDIREMLELRNSLYKQIFIIDNYKKVLDDYLKEFHPEVLTHCPTLVKELDDLQKYIMTAKKSLVDFISYGSITDLGRYIIDFDPMQDVYLLYELNRGVATTIDAYILDINQAILKYRADRNIMVGTPDQEGFDKNNKQITAYKLIKSKLETIQGNIENLASIKANIQTYYIDVLPSIFSVQELKDTINNINLLEFEPYLQSDITEVEKENWTNRVLELKAENEKLNKILSTKGKQIVHIRPIVLLFNRYEMSNINAWDGNKIYTGNNQEFLLAPQVGAGYKDDKNQFTGMVMGLRKTTEANTQTGLFGYHEGQQSVFLNAKNGSAIFGKAGNGGQIIIDPNAKNALLYSSNYWDKYDKETGLPQSYGDGNLNKKDNVGQGMLINLSEPSIKWGNGNFSVDKDGFAHIGGGGNGDIGGWNIYNDRLESADKKITLHSKDKYIKFADANGKVYSGSHDTLDSKVNGFYLSHDGLSIGAGLNASSDGVLKVGKLTGTNYWTIDGNNTDSYISCGTKGATNSVYLGTDQISLGANFKVDKTGKLTSKSGTIGGWTVGETQISSNGIVLNSNGSLSGGSGTTTWSISGNGKATFNDIVIGGGELTIGDDFHVSNTGVLTANNLIANEGGTIGGWVIGPSSLKSNNNKVVLNNNGSIVCGTAWALNNDGSAKIGNISISNAGVISASGGTFSDITASGGNFNSITVDGNSTFKGTLSGASGDFTGEVKATKGTFTSGTFSSCTINSSCKINCAISGDLITTGTIAAARIKVGDMVFDASQTTSGTFTAARIPNLSASKITTGTLSADRIDVNGIFAKNITATGTITGATLSGATISGGTLSIGKNFSVDKEGKLEAYGGRISGWFFDQDSLWNADGAGINAYTEFTAAKLTAGATGHVRDSAFWTSIVYVANELDGAVPYAKTGYIPFSFGLVTYYLCFSKGILCKMAETETEAKKWGSRIDDPS